MEFLKSSVLTVHHGFPTRFGGVSRGPYESLNTSLAVGDDAGAVVENLSRVKRAAKATELLDLRQVHGTTIVHDVAGAEADGVWTSRVGVAACVRTADCLPVLVEDALGKRVGAVHAGWRGVKGLIAVKLVNDFGADVVVLHPGRPKPHLDLKKALSRSLTRAGVLPENLDALPECTMCDDRFFSHRRSGGVTGRHLSFITCAFTSDSVATTL